VINKLGIAVYDKSGNYLIGTNLNDFFRMGTNFPTGDMQDSRMLYDQESDRWVACAQDQGSGQVALAVSNDANPTNLSSGWSRYLIAEKRDGNGLGLQAMGMDANGIYVDVRRFLGYPTTSTNGGHSIIAIKKPEIYQANVVTSSLEISNAVPVWYAQPAVNFDPVPTNGYAWIIGKGPPDLSASYRGGAILYRPFHWVGTNVEAVGTGWITITKPGPTYRDYYDLDGTNAFVAFDLGTSVAAPEATAEGGYDINLHFVGSSLTSSAVISRETLWVSHVVGVAGTSGVYVGSDPYGTNVDRSAIQWFKLAVDGAGGSLGYLEHGRIYDNATTNAHWYYFPSIAVNCAGYVVAAFSGSSATNYVGAYYSWRPACCSGFGIPRLVKDGETTWATENPKWGDYTAAVVDPDGLTIWTVQEYVGPVVDNEPDNPHWRTIIAKIYPLP